MANVLTDLAADIYKAADIVGRELVGVIPSVMINSNGSDRVAQGDTVRSHVTEASTVNTSYTPSMTIPQGDDQTVGNKTMTIDKVGNVQIPWTGEDIKHVNNGSGYETIFGDQIAQAMRGITNAIEGELWGEVKANASRAVGTAGTTPFASNFDVIAEARQILVDNGTPMDGQVTMVLNTAAGTKMRNLATLQKANEAGGTNLLRQGELLDLQGVKLKESAGVGLHTKGTGTGYLQSDGGILAIGTTSIPLDTGSGTVLAGDVVTFTGDTNKYIVATGVAAPGTIVLASPGLQKTLANNVAMTIGATYTGNVAFHRNAVELVARVPSQPHGGDAAVDRMTIQDPHSGLVYEIAAYKGYGKVMFDVTMLYGVKTWKQEFTAALLG